MPRFALAVLIALFAFGGPAYAGTTTLPKGPQDCVNSLNANWLGVLKAQGKDTAGCLKDVAAGKSTLESCLGADLKGKVAKAEAKTEKTNTDKCGAPNEPSFAYTSPATLDASAKGASLASFDTIFGASPNVALKAADKAGAACQAEVLKRHAKLQETWAAEANKAKKEALKGSASVPAAQNGTELGAAIDDAISASTKLAKAENGVNTGIANKCPDALVSNLFDCGDAASSNELTLCVIRAAKDDGCTAFEQGDGIPLACPSDTLLVGAASRSVLPLVEGSYDYLAAGFPARSDPFDLGILVPAWDDGRIAVGNGATESFWVHDDLRTTAVAFQRLGKREIVVVVGTDLYMVFRLDADEIRSKAAALLGAELAANTRILVTATHNHHGPDTAFDVNHDWYEHMTDQVAATIAEAVAARSPATLRVAAGEHWFGAKDGTDPQVYDPRLNVLQATGTKGGVIATLVQWNNHPEMTLGWSPPLEAIADDCVVLGLVGDDCQAEGRYFTSDYPGILRQDLAARYGGEVLYMNGALGVIIGPGGAQVWEVDDQHPLGNQMVAPAGAEAPGGGTDYTQRELPPPRHHRRAARGRRRSPARRRGAPRHRHGSPTRSSPSTRGSATSASACCWWSTRRRAGATSGTTRPRSTPARPSVRRPTRCASTTRAATTEDGLLGFTYRTGDHLKTAVEYVRIGPVGMMFLTGEVPGEVTIGLPAGFRTTPEDWYAEAPGNHTFGADFTTPGYVLSRMSDTYKWTIGLGSDQLGYHVPIANFRALCVGDEVSRPRDLRDPLRQREHRVPGFGGRHHLQGAHREPGPRHPVPGGRELPLRPGARRGQRTLRGDELCGLGPGRRHAERRRRDHRERRRHPSEPRLPGLVAGPAPAGRSALSG